MRTRGLGFQPTRVWYWNGEKIEEAKVHECDLISDRDGFGFTVAFHATPPHTEIILCVARRPTTAIDYVRESNAWSPDTPVR
jgi:hypothetical protein